MQKLQQNVCPQTNSKKHKQIHHCEVNSLEQNIFRFTTSQYERSKGHVIAFYICKLSLTLISRVLSMICLKHISTDNYNVIHTNCAEVVYAVIKIMSIFITSSHSVSRVEMIEFCICNICIYMCACILLLGPTCSAGPSIYFDSIGATATAAAG